MNLNMLGAVPVADSPRGLPVASVTVSPAAVTIKVGDVVDFTVVAVDNGGKAHRPSVVSWTSTGGAVDPTGRFVSAEPGSFQVNARVGQASGLATVMVEPLEESATEDDPVAEVYDDLEHPRQGLAAFRATQEEIDFESDSRLRFRRHYPDLSELENRFYDEGGAALWAGFGPDAVGFDYNSLADRAKAKREEIKSISPVTVAVARKIAAGAMRAAERALVVIRSPEYKKATDGKQGMTEYAAGLPYWHIKWHIDNLVKFQSKPDSTLYPDAEDLKKWAIQAFSVLYTIEYTGAVYDQIEREFWTDVKDSISRTASAAGDALSSPIRSLTGLPWWGWALLLSGLVAGGGYLLWLLIGRAGAREVVLRRLGGAPW